MRVRLRGLVRALWLPATLLVGVYGSDLLWPDTPSPKLSGVAIALLALVGLIAHYPEIVHGKPRRALTKRWVAGSFPASERTSSPQNDFTERSDLRVGDGPHEDVSPSESRPDLLHRMAATPVGTAALGAAFGALLALILLLFGAMGLLFGLLAGIQTDLSDWRFIPYYIGGFAVGGMAAGALWSIRRWIGGAYGLGIVMMSVVFTAIMRAEEGPFSGWDTADWIIVLALAVLFGAVLGYTVRHDTLA